MEEEENRGVTRLKNAIYSETITSKPKYKDTFMFKSKVKIIVSTNHFPCFHDKTTGMKRRILVVPFNAMIPVYQKKLNFFEQMLEPELPGIFNFALGGLRRLQKGKFVIPKEVKKLSEAKFRSRDSVSEFVHQKCVLGTAHLEEVALFYSKYLKFCNSSGLIPKSKIMFGKQLRTIDSGIKWKQKTKLKKNDTHISVAIRVAT